MGSDEQEGAFEGTIWDIKPDAPFDLAKLEAERTVQREQEDKALRFRVNDELRQQEIAQRRAEEQQRWANRPAPTGGLNPLDAIGDALDHLFGRKPKR